MTEDSADATPMPPFSRIRPDTVLGQRVVLPGYCNLYGCTIGDDCTIGPFVEIQCDAVIGQRVKVQSHTFICSGVTIEDEAFIGHGVMFINDKYPRSTTADGKKQGAADWTCQRTVIGRRASIGSNATILGGVKIGAGAMIGAGSVVTRDVAAGFVAAGNPARVLRRVGPEEDVTLVEAATVKMNSADPAQGGTVPFLDLASQHRQLKAELLAVAERAIDSAAFIGGPVVEQFEREFAAACQCEHAIGVASGTDALRFALQSLGVGPGTSVITVPNTFIATAASITHSGGAIEFVDVDPETCLMDPNRLEEFLRRRSRSGRGPKPRVVLPVHLYGQCAEMEAIVDIARRYEMKVLEDAAQAHGSLYRGRAAGTLGDAAAFSFYPGKNLGACGEGGAVTTNDAAIAKQVRLLRDHGRETKYTHVIEGYNGRLDAMQAGFLLVKLKHLSKSNQTRRKWAAFYDVAFRETKQVRPVVVRPGRVSCRHLYVVRSAARDDLQQFLAGRQIATGVHYPVPLHLQPCYSRLGHRKGAFPVAEAACEQVLSLPLFPEMNQTQVARVVDAVLEFEHSAGSPPVSVKAA